MNLVIMGMLPTAMATLFSVTLPFHLKSVLLTLDLDWEW